MATKAESVIKKTVPLWLIGVTVLALAVVIMGGIFVGRGLNPSVHEVITQSVLENIIEVSELSTYEAVYNGVATVMNEKNTEKVDYYVSYEAKIKVGFDFDEIDIQVDQEQKTVCVSIPTVKINDVNVDITSLDYIFMNDKANTQTVSQQAYRACEEDAEAESAAQEAITKLAQQTARDFVDALIRPFVEQMDPEFTIEIRQEGQL